MKIGRTLPPAATPIGISEIMSGVCALFRGQRELDRFQSELAEYFGVKHCFLASSGQAALTLTLAALKDLSPERDEVVIPAFTCYSVPSSILRAGLRIKLCDLAPDTLDFDFTKLHSLLSEAPGRQTGTAISDHATAFAGALGAPAMRNRSANRVLAILPTHLFGFPADLSALQDLVQDPEIAIVEDAAQAMGEVLQNRKLGTLGDVGFFSLGRGKAFTTVEGGVILTDRDDIARILDRRVSRLPRYGFLQQIMLIAKSVAMMIFVHPSFFWIPRSMPYLELGATHFELHFPILKMSAFQAGLSRQWRERLRNLRETRQANSKQWTEMIDALEHKDFYFHYLQLPGLIRFPIKVHDQNSREEILRISTSKGLGIMPVYPESINRLPGLGFESQAGAYPVAESRARELITLPTHEFLKPEDVEAVRQILSHALDMKGRGTT